jgi:hypothetical protein
VTAFDGRSAPMTAEARRRLREAVSAARKRQAAAGVTVGKGLAGRMLLALPEMIAEQAARGLPVHIVFAEPVSPAAERLLRTLGATWEVRPRR